jgi:hypothetical protein
MRNNHRSYSKKKKKNKEERKPLGRSAPHALLPQPILAAQPTPPPTQVGALGLDTALFLALCASDDSSSTHSRDELANAISVE